MSFGLALEALLKVVRVALASMLLVGVPLADAAMCAGDDRPGYQSVATVDGDSKPTKLHGASDQDKWPPEDAQHCVHGHCHHSTPMRASPDAGVALAIAIVRSSVRPDDRPAPERAVGVPDRPPRA